MRILCLQPPLHVVIFNLNACYWRVLVRTASGSTVFVTYLNASRITGRFDDRSTCLNAGLMSTCPALRNAGLREGVEKKTKPEMRNLDANTLNNTSMYSSSSSPEMRNRGIRTRSSRRVQEGTVAIPGSELCEADTDGSTDGVISRMTTRSKHLAKVTTAENETVLENELIRFAILLLVSRYRSGECSAAVVKQIEILAEGVKVKKSTIKSARYANKSVHLAIAFKKLLAVLNTDLYKHMIIDLICDRTVTLSEARRLNQELCYQLSRR
ncbi:unnamed protein product [Toxocara canis]|uniref:Uncharacterized protein n=1 Tax=Toxocara canis TaxID=6265 RepID=A0A183URR1_TOXCA|nr:unnamed protein product [Toxocara canis]